MIPLQTLFGQSLRDKISNLFGKVLEIQLAGSPGKHGKHFEPANVTSSNAMVSSFSNFIAANVSSFPLSSTVAGLTFDFSTGEPVSTTTSLGPIFAERAQTLGKGQLNLGFNFSFLNLAKLRGLNTKDLRFTFTHQDVGESGLGDSDNEFDTIDFFTNLDLDASILAFFVTVGVTNRLDIGIAVPFVNVSIKADPRAIINSFTLTANDSANHLFGGTPKDPELTQQSESINDDATGTGDIAIRAKYNFLKGKKVDLSALLEYQPPTGDEEDFLGAGKSTFRAGIISSGILGNFAPHLNLAYERRRSDLDRDEIEVVLGYDLKVAEGVTLATEFLRELEIGSEIEGLQFPEPVIIQRPIGSTVFRREVSLTNIPQFSHDHILNVAFGLKFNPKKELIIIGNVFVPVNDGGLRSSVIPTFGFEFTF